MKFAFDKCEFFLASSHPELLRLQTKHNECMHTTTRDTVKVVNVYICKHCPALKLFIYSFCVLSGFKSASLCMLSSDSNHSAISPSNMTCCILHSILGKCTSLRNTCCPRPTCRRPRGRHTAVVRSCM